MVHSHGGGHQSSYREEWIFGIHSILEALRSGRRKLDRIWIAKGKEETAIREVLFRARQSKIPVMWVPREKLDRVTGGDRHQGVGALATPIPYLDLGAVLLRRHVGDWSRLLVVLDEVTEPYNLASLIRSAEVCGATGMVLPERRSASVGPSVAKLAAGAEAHLPIARVGNLGSALERVKADGVRVIGAVTEGGRDPAELDLRGEVAIVLGNEAKGLRRTIRATCDELATIPQRGAVGSLSVSVAGAILLYEVGRQRRAPRKSDRP